MRRLTALGVAGVSLVAVAVLHASGGGPALYDGLCTPPQYKTLGANPPPPSVSMSFPASQLGQTQTLADNDTTPQAQIIIGAGTLVAAPGASEVTVAIAPVKPPAQVPGPIDGNVYDFTATSGGKPVVPAAAHPVTIALGSTSSSGPTLTLERFDGSRWTALKTFQSGCGSTYDAASPSLGLFALVAPGSGGSGAPASSGPSSLIVVVIVVVVLALVIVGIRASRSGRRGRGRGRGRR